MKLRNRFVLVALIGSAPNSIVVHPNGAFHSVRDIGGARRSPVVPDVPTVANQTRIRVKG